MSTNQHGDFEIYKDFQKKRVPMDDVTQARYYTSQSHKSDLVALRRKLHDVREIIPDDQRLLDDFTGDVGINLNKTVYRITDPKKLQEACNQVENTQNKVIATFSDYKIVEIEEYIHQVRLITIYCLETFAEFASANDAAIE